jgi:serine/threonine protein kinase
LASTNIHVTGFGSAAFDGEFHMKMVSTRLYRAPEVILRLGWGHPCDMWSIGCILFELYNGKAPLFHTDDDLEHLVMMEETLGPFPSKMVMGSRLSSRQLGTKQCFDRKGAVLWPKKAKKGHRPRLVRKGSAIHLKDDRSCRTLEEWIPTKQKIDADFLSLLQSLLVYSVDERITARGTLQHTFCTSFSEKEYAKYLRRRNADWNAWNGVGGSVDQGGGDVGSDGDDDTSSDEEDDLAIESMESNPDVSLGHLNVDALIGQGFGRSLATGKGRCENLETSYFFLTVFRLVGQ